MKANELARQLLNKAESRIADRHQKCAQDENIDTLYFMLEKHVDNLSTIDNIKDVPGYLEDLINKLIAYKQVFEALNEEK